MLVPGQVKVRTISEYVGVRAGKESAVKDR